mmetsp:Transcript_79262/g.227368  ORF Transcript_79262/g.227368 Transcript_79262/m.227368 type:complete len:220 (-) Transcript_79262:6-665(-)
MSASPTMSRASSCPSRPGCGRGSGRWTPSTWPPLGACSAGRWRRPTCFSTVSSVASALAPSPPLAPRPRGDRRRPWRIQRPRGKRRRCFRPERWAGQVRSPPARASPPRPGPGSRLRRGRRHHCRLSRGPAPPHPQSIWTSSWLPAHRATPPRFGIWRPPRSLRWASPGPRLCPAEAGAAVGDCPRPVSDPIRCGDGVRSLGAHRSPPAHWGALPMCMS